MKYIALLRGINVSGQKLIKMEHLKSLFEAMSLKNVQTYIQSGNVVFDAAQKAAPLRSLIEKELENQLGYAVPVLLRTAAEMSQLANFNPFSSRKMPGTSMIYVSFLEKIPLPEQQTEFLSMENKNEFLAFEGAHLYTQIRKDTSDKILFTNMLLERKLKQQATTRNINTVLKLSQLAGK